MSAIGLELGVLAVMLLVFFGGLFGRRDDTRRVGVISVLGLVVLLGVALRMEPGATWLGEGFVQDVASCIVPSMPERALQHAGADVVGSPERLGQVLSSRRKPS